MESKQTKTAKLLELLTAAGSSGILNSDIAATLGWTFNSRIATLRQQGHIIEKRHVAGRLYRFILLKSAPAPEERPIMALLLAAQEGGRG